MCTATTTYTCQCICIHILLLQVYVYLHAPVHVYVYLPSLPTCIEVYVQHITIRFPSTPPGTIGNTRQCQYLSVHMSFQSSILIKHFKCKPPAFIPMYVNGDALTETSLVITVHLVFFAWVCCPELVEFRLEVSYTPVTMEQKGAIPIVEDKARNSTDI